MSLHTLLKKSLNLLKSNAPEILTGLGVGGVVATSVLAAKGGRNAVIKIEDEKEIFRTTGKTSFGAVPTVDQDDFLTDWQKVKLLFPCYAPAVVSGAVTIVCIVASQKTAGRRTSAAIAAYSISEKAFSEYKEKVLEEIGPGKEEKIRGKIAQDKVDNNPPKSSEVIITKRGEVLFQEGLTGRYLRTEMESIRKAVNDFNYILNHDLEVCLGEFYDLIGLDQTTQSPSIGWTSEQQLDLHFHAVVDQKAGEPCIVFEYITPPKALWV